MSSDVRVCRKLEEFTSILLLSGGKHIENITEFNEIMRDDLTLVGHQMETASVLDTIFSTR
jgi:hypothetical protein